MQKHRFRSLDSLRGCAALMVCSWHYYLVNHPADILGTNAKPWLFFHAGPEAVLLFFTLSGFVLSEMLTSNIRVGVSYPQYLVRRVFRIYPAYYFAMLLSIIIFLLLKPQTLNQLSAWFNGYAGAKLSFKVVLNTVLLIFGVGNDFNNVTWSLTYEMLISIIFPIIYKLIVQTKTVSLKNLGLYALLFIIFLVLSKNVFDIDPNKILYYLQYFIVGAWLHKHRDKLNFLNKDGFLVLGLLLYFSKFVSLGILGNEFIYNEITLLGIAILIINALHNKISTRVLNLKIFQFYGRISYSFYILHLPVIYVCAYIFYNYFGLNLLTTKITAFAITTGLGQIVYTQIELRFIQVAKKLTHGKSNLRNGLRCE